MGLTSLQRSCRVAMRAALVRWRKTLLPWCVMPYALLCSCGTSPKGEDRTITSQDEAASVRVSAVMVAPWQDIESVLQPNFTMNGDLAASDVLPTTSHIQDQLLSAVAASLGIGLPQTSRQGSSTQTSSSSNNSSTAAGVTTVTSNLANGVSTTSTTTTAPGVVPTVPSGVPAGTQSLTPTANTAALGIDPALRYKAANYLNEQVQLLNKEVQYASQAKCMVPYVVKLRFAVMLRKPGIAYSAHTFVSFFNEDVADPFAPPKSPASGASAVSTTSAALAPSAASATNALASSNINSERRDSPCEFGDKLVVPTVVPLLAADDINVALKSNTAEMATQLGFALSLMEHGVGASGNLDKIKQSIHSISDQELSSTLTVTMQSINTLYVRIAPNNEYDDPALIGQTYDIAVLLLVPRGYFDDPTNQGKSTPNPVKIELSALTELRDAKSGKLPNLMATDYQAAEFDQFVTKWVPEQNKINAWRSTTPQDRKSVAGALVHAVEDADLRKFYKELREQSPQTYPCGSQPKNSSDAVSASAPATTTPPAQSETQVNKNDTQTNKTANGNSLGCFFQTNVALAMWNDLNLLLTNWPNVDVDFEVPRPADLIVPASETALVLDDGKQNAQVTLYNVAGTSAASFGAYLAITPDGTSGAPAMPANLTAQTVSLDPVTHVLTLTFPSPQKWGLRKPTTNPPKPPKGAKAVKVAQAPSSASDALYIFANCQPDDKDRLCPAYKGPSPLHAQIITSASEAEAGNASFKVAQGSNVIDEASDGKGVMSFVISGLKAQKGQPAPTVAIAITGADVGNATNSGGTALTLGDSGYVVTQNGTYTFNLFNLSPGAKVTATAQQIKASASGPSTKVGTASTATYSIISLAAENRR